MDKPLALTLGKLLVAVAWADGTLQDEEVEVLKDLIYSLPDLSREDWASIEVYMQSPVTGKECQLLMDKFRSMLKTEEQKRYALNALRRVLGAGGGNLTKEEKALFHVLHEEIESASGGFASKIGEFFEASRDHRKRTLNRIPKRERNLDDFIDNPVFYHAFQRITARGIVIHMNRAELEKLCTAGALMAAIAQADGEVDPMETLEIKEAFMKHWKVNKEASEIVAEIAVDHEVIGLDLLRLCRKLFQETTDEERKHFFLILCDIIRADNKVVADELERVRAIATHLKLPSAYVQKELPLLTPLEELERMELEKLEAEAAALIDDNQDDKPPPAV